jgi:hypothetical protein
MQILRRLPTILALLAFPTVLALAQESTAPDAQKPDAQKKEAEDPRRSR